MTPPTDLVLRSDIQKEVEYLDQSIRSLYSYYMNARALGAPESLLAELATAWRDVETARNRLQHIVPCFPEK